MARDRLLSRRQVRAAAQACNFRRLHARGATYVHRHGFRSLNCMMRPRARLKPLTLTRAEQEQLEQWVCHGRRALAVRARIVLGCQAGCSNQETAKRLHVAPQTVGKWRARYVAHGMQGLADETRTGAPRSISDALVEAVLAKTLHEKPPDAVRWSSRRLAATLGVSQRTVLRIWRTFGL
ncbi:MAG: helix-turn-helix domain-containing protein [Gammaproteobacteria bacterium]|nr:MAG: helix-turn-helix domain-containing protein [Gammaproteobacteria bacterium]TLY66986.1 MAG: helix-turn-helix domain-containing protein [Gammaproteobacteria bacterium]TLY85479.1 MAG: helix-turn-helix domain-containing protein [Gammaproteobacteria bacterium]